MVSLGRNRSERNGHRFSRIVRLLFTTIYYSIRILTKWAHMININLGCNNKEISN